jgi:hypothetical protein
MPGFPPQTSVTYFPDIGLNGQLADTGHHDITTGLADTSLDCGLAVVLGANGYQSIKLPGSSGDVTNTIKGWTLYRAMKEPNDPRYVIHDAVDVLRVGRIWIIAQGDLVDEGPVYVVHSGANAGKVRGDNTGATLVSRAKVIQGATAGNLAKISVNLP